MIVQYNPWDIGTRRCGSGGTCGGSEHRTNATTVCNASICNNRNACTMCDARVIAGLLKEMNGDGFVSNWKDALGIVAADANLPPLCV